MHCFVATKTFQDGKSLAQGVGRTRGCALFTRWFIACVLILFAMNQRGAAVTLNEIGRYFPTGTHRQISGWAANGSLAAITPTPGLVDLYDLSDVANPVHRGTHSLPGGIVVRLMKGPLIFAENSQSRIVIIDAGNPDRLAVLSTQPAGVEPWDMLADGDFLYINGWGTNVCFDVSVPTAPRRLGSMEGSWVIAAHGPTLFEAQGSIIRVIDFTDAAEPRVTQTIDGSPGHILFLTRGENRLYAVNANEILEFDISEGSMGKRLRRGALATPPTGFTMDWPFAYALSPTNSVEVFNVSIGDQLNSIETARLDSHWWLRARNVEAIGAVGGRLFSQKDCIEIFDAQQGLKTPAASEIGRPDTLFEIDVAGNHAFVASLGGGLRVIDARNPSNMVQVARHMTRSSAFDVTVKSNVACVAVGFAGLEMIDVTRPDAPARMALLDTPGFATTVCREGTVAYVGDNTGGFHVVNIADPSRPRFFDSMEFPEPIIAVAAKGRLAFAGTPTRLHFLDVTDPADVRLIHSRNMGFHCKPIVPVREKVFVRSYYVELGSVFPSFAGGTSGYDGVFANGFLFATHDGRAAVYDVRTSRVAATVTPGYPYGVDVEAGRLFLPTWDRGLAVYAITNPPPHSRWHEVSLPTFESPLHGGATVTVEWNMGYAFDPDFEYQWSILMQNIEVETVATRIGENRWRAEVTVPHGVTNSLDSLIRVVEELTQSHGEVGPVAFAEPPRVEIRSRGEEITALWHAFHTNLWLYSSASITGPWLKVEATADTFFSNGEMHGVHRRPELREEFYQLRPR